MSALEFLKATKLGLLGRTCSWQVLLGSFLCVFFFFKTAGSIGLLQSKMKDGQ